MSVTMTDLLYPCPKCKTIYEIVRHHVRPAVEPSARYAKSLFLLPMGMIGLRTNELVQDSNKWIRAIIFLNCGHLLHESSAGPRSLG